MSLQLPVTPQEADVEQASAPETCLGQTFPDTDARRTHFREKLRAKLRDPRFRSMEGFPLGADEDIVQLSDPPYYTACPNPWLADIVAEWEGSKPEPVDDRQYSKEPFVANVSEGKNHPIYNAQSYHTKIPHKAIMHYILHYTSPGDILMDGFCGSGMTGVAAMMCGDRDAVISLGYRVDEDGAVLRKEVDADGTSRWLPFSRIGVRHAILSDLSTAATFIAANYNIAMDSADFAKVTQEIIDEVEEECGWLYATQDSSGQDIGKIKHTVWSDVFGCPECARQLIYWDVAADSTEQKVQKKFKCPHCDSTLTRRALEPILESWYDEPTGEAVMRAKQLPVKVLYLAEGNSGKKPLAASDQALIQDIERRSIPYWYPTQRMMKGSESRRNDPIGLTHVHHFFTKRNLWALSALYAKCHDRYRHLFQSIAVTLCSRLVRYNQGKRGNGLLSGTLYVPPLNAESNVFRVARNKAKNLAKVFPSVSENVVQCQSFESMPIKSDSLDYVFLDPPFGSNLFYSELNYLTESWLKVLTNKEPEAVENDTHGKGIPEYRRLMTKCFAEAHRVLKPGRWLTVVFSNTKAAIWNSIQVALADAGFVVASVSALDKKQGSFKAVTTPTAVRQDLVISAYKPPRGLIEGICDASGATNQVWEFVRLHLEHLPVVRARGAGSYAVAEREPRLLFDQMVAYFVRSGFSVPMSSQKFQSGLTERFAERDGMYFLPDQAAEYDQKADKGKGEEQLDLFIVNEESAIRWLYQVLKAKPQTFAEVYPQFMQLIGGWNKSEKTVDLRELLNQNFLCYDGTGPVPEQIHAHLSRNWKNLRQLAKDNPKLVKKATNRWYVPDARKSADLERLREKALLKEFDAYKNSRRSLPFARSEAVRAGFKHAWQQRDYKTIVNVAERLPRHCLDEDPIVLLLFDKATVRMGAG